MLSASSIGKFLGGDLMALLENDRVRSAFQETVATLMFHTAIRESDRRLAYSETMYKDDVMSTPDYMINEGLSKVVVVLSTNSDKDTDYGLYIQGVIHCYIQGASKFIVIKQDDNKDFIKEEYTPNRMVATKAITLCKSMLDSVDFGDPFSSMVSLSPEHSRNVRMFMEELKHDSSVEVDLTEELQASVHSYVVDATKISLMIELFNTNKLELLMRLQPHNNVRVGRYNLKVVDGEIEISGYRDTKSNKLSKKWLSFYRKVEDTRLSIRGFKTYKNDDRIKEVTGAVMVRRTANKYRVVLKDTNTIAKVSDGSPVDNGGFITREAALTLVSAINNKEK